MSARRLSMALLLVVSVLTASAAAGSIAASAVPLPAGLDSDSSVTAVRNPPDDPLWPAQWGPRMINVPDAWASLPGKWAGAGAGVTVAILGDGVHGFHADLAAASRTDGYACQLIAVLGTYGCMDSPPVDQGTISTYQAGVIGASVNNGIGIAGIAPATRIIGIDTDVRNNVSAERATADATAPNVNSVSNTDGVRGALRRGADVILAPFNARQVLPCTLVAEVVAAGSTMILPAGTSTSASCPGAIGVGAFDRNGAVTAGSSADLTVMAPGKEIWTTRTACCNPTEAAYALRDGADVAAAHVAGVVSMLLSSWDHDLDARLVKRVLAQTALRPAGLAFYPDPFDLGCTVPCPWSSQVGYGVVDAGALARRPTGFTMAVADELVVGRGATHTTPIAVASSQPVTYEVSGSIPGGSASVVTSGGSPVLSVTTSSSTPPGTYRVTVVGSVQGWPQAEPVDVHVDTVSLSTTPRIVRRSASMPATFDVTLRRHGYGGAVTYAVSGLPPATTASVSPTASGARITVTTSATKATGCGAETLIGSLIGLYLEGVPGYCLSVPTPWGARALTITATGSGGVSASDVVELIVGDRVEQLDSIGHYEGLGPDCSTFAGGLCTTLVPDDVSVEVFMPKGKALTYWTTDRFGRLLQTGSGCYYLALPLAKGASLLQISPHSLRSPVTCGEPRAGYLPTGQVTFVHRTH